MSSIKMTPTKHEPRTETLRIPGSSRKPRPPPLQPLRQAPGPLREGSIRLVSNDGSSSVYSTSLLRRPSVETRCSTLKSDIINYYLYSGTSNASATTIPAEQVPQRPAAFDFGELNETWQDIDGNRPLRNRVVTLDQQPGVSEHEQPGLHLAGTGTGLTPTATVSPSDFPDNAIAGFNFALDEDEPAFALLDQESPPPAYLSFESSPPTSPLPRPPAPTPTYSLFPTITTPPRLLPGLTLPLRLSSSTTHTRSTSSSSSILYAPSTVILSPPAPASSLPRRPHAARIRSPTLTSPHTTPSTSSSATIRPSLSSANSSKTKHKRDFTSSSSFSSSVGSYSKPGMRWSGDTDTDTASRSVSASHPLLELTPLTSPTTMVTPMGSVTTSYISSKKRMSRPLLRGDTFEEVKVSVFDNDESEDEEGRGGGRWWRRVSGGSRGRGGRGGERGGSWGRRGGSWGSLASGIGGGDGGEGRSVRAVMGQGGRERWGSGRTRRRWGCCGL